MRYTDGIRETTLCELNPQNKFDFRSKNLCDKKLYFRIFVYFLSPLYFSHLLTHAYHDIVHIKYATDLAEVDSNCRYPHTKKSCCCIRF